MDNIQLIPLNVLVLNKECALVKVYNDMILNVAFPFGVLVQATK